MPIVRRRKMTAIPRIPEEEKSVTIITTLTTTFDMKKLILTYGNPHPGLKVVRLCCLDIS